MFSFATKDRLYALYWQMKCLTIEPKEILLLHLTRLAECIQHVTEPTNVGLFQIIIRRENVKKIFIQITTLGNLSVSKLQTVINSFHYLLINPQSLIQIIRITKTETTSKRVQPKDETRSFVFVYFHLFNRFYCRTHYFWSNSLW